jgi:hypothetical protein
MRVSSKYVQARLGDRHWRRLAIFGVTLHLVFLMTAQFEHHDLLCHVKTPFHCTSCASSALGSDPHTPAGVGACALDDAGRAVTFCVSFNSPVRLVRIPGRSPPLPV